MILISHRGNLSGLNPDLENSEKYINTALSLGFDVEIDIRNVSNGNKSDNMKTISNRKPYMEFYNKERIQIVADWYKKDINFWGYDFNSGPTRNYWNM